MRVVICGGGVIGASTAWYLCEAGADVVVVERTGVACAASGKSGGFLARDWCDGTPLSALARRSFDLHARLPARIGGDWGYRPLDTLAVVTSARRDLRAFGRLAAPEWLGPAVAVHQRLATTATAAQVDPAAFTQALMAGACARGARLRIGAVEGVTLSPDGSAAVGAVVDGARIDADAVVIAMGPWTALACRWLPLPAVSGLKGHSVVFGAAPGELPHALFAEVEGADGSVYSPEVFPRPNGTTYVCGARGHAALPDDPADVQPEGDACERLAAMAARLYPALGRAERLATQACYRPMVEDGLPLIGRVPGVANAYVATGHGVWGILNGPATGEALTGLILDGAATHVDLRPFDPARLPPLRTR